MRRHRERRHRLRSAVALGALVLGVGSLSGGAGAQTADGDLLAQFGGYELSASGNGIVFTYDIKNALPVSPVLSLGLPEAQASMTSGSGSALASLAYPGPLIADIGAALRQGGQDVPIPPYPVRTQAFFPGDQTEQRSQALPGTDMVALAQETFSEGSSKYGGIEIQGLVDVGAVEVRARTEILDGQVVGRTRVHQGDIDLLSGLIHIESVVTDIVATSNGEQAETKGTTTVQGVTVLGQAASIDADGVHVAQTQPPPGPAEQAAGPLGEALKPVVEGVKPVTDALSQVITQVAGAGKTFNDALQATGISIRVLAPTEVVEGPSATINAGGLGITLNYPGASDERFAQLLSLLPTDQLPSEGIPGLGLGPQALANMLKETHVANIGIAAASASTVASAAFDLDAGFDASTGDFASGDFGTGDFGSIDVGAGGFETEVPSLPQPGEGVLAGSGLAASGAAIPLTLILVTIFTAPMWAAVSRRFAEATVGGAAAACPVGKDQPTTPGSA